MERKFKHKLTNKVIKIGGKTGLSCQTLIGNSNLILGDIIKGEDWEEVVEKDYEIISYIHNGSKHIWKKDSQLKDTFCIEDGKSPFTRLEDILKYPKIYSIYSIKRKSDDEIFAIGDKVFSEYVNYTINEISIVNDKCMVSALYDTNNPNGSRLHYNLNNIKKSKQPLFTTEDGVDIFEGDNLYSIDNMLNIKKHLLFNARYDDNTLLNNRIFFNSDYKHFSTKEKAEEYILYNKPLLTLKDIEELLCKNTSSYFLEKFKKRAQKLNNKN